MRRSLVVVLLLAALQSLYSQTYRNLSVAFWNTENFYDTIPSLFYDDSDYTADGWRKWGAVRYGEKLRNIARVIDDMSPDVIGLAEIESETAVRDLVMTLQTDYNYIYRTSGDSRGMDIALLYKGDKFFPESIRQVRSGTGREFLHVTAEMLGERVELLVCHMASNLNDYQYRRRNMETLRGTLEKLLAEDSAVNIIVIGDMNSVPTEKVVRRTLGSVRHPYDIMYCPHSDEARSGKGTYRYRSKWFMYDWMLVSPAIARSSGMKVENAGIFVREYMTESITPGSMSARKPLRSFDGRRYLGGYSDHLPVYMILTRVDRQQ